MSETAESYIPGVCNINRKEIAYRRKAGYIGLVLFVVVAVLLLLTDLNRFIRLIVFVPAFVATIGFLQAKNKFCVSYAASGQQNASDDSTKAQAIASKSAHQKDRARARTMNLQAAASAVVATAIIVVI